MINILIPMAGKESFFNESNYYYPKALVEIKGLTMIERVINNLSHIGSEIRFIFILNKQDAVKYHLDNTLKLLTHGSCHIIYLDHDTQGSACSALMAIEKINNDDPLIISNYDQLFDTIILNELLNFFSTDAGIIVFDSVHPRWSFAKLDDQNHVIEAAEKNPISRNAIAGLYYFKTGNYFIAAAMKMIRRGESVNGVYYIAPSLNQMILQGQKIRAQSINNKQYVTFYSPHKIKEFENSISPS